ncbi:MAG: rubrerythrin family protein [Treponema sp.]|nr:rubrerythrin family protein [Treponema sp.]
MAKLKGTRTEANLLTAYAGESQVHTKYMYYADKAEEEGYPLLGTIFREASGNEREHAKIWFKFLHGEKIPSTRENLRDAMEGEDFEHNEMYAEFAQTAREEGFEKLAFLFESIGKIEKEHGDRFRKLLDGLEQGLVAPHDDTILWQCDYCGHGIIEKEAPELCPVCEYPKAFFEIRATNKAEE